MKIIGKPKEKSITLKIGMNLLQKVQFLEERNYANINFLKIIKFKILKFKFDKFLRIVKFLRKNLADSDI